MNRGIPLIDVKHYLNTTDEDIYPPKLIKNISDGAKLLIKHINSNSNTVLQIDSDCDGFTSFAVFMNYFNTICPAWVQNHVTYMPHKNKHHGIVIEDIPEGTKLIIALDASSNEYEIHEELRKRGIDILVIDHHLTDHESENACVLNNQLCDYPNKALSGVGMVYKFCCYFDSLLEENYADDYLDLVALGLVGDMMDLRSMETKHLINKGFAQIRSPFIKEMQAKNEYNLKGTLTPMGVAFYIVPYINAIARVGTYEECLLLAESMLEYRAYEQIPSTKRGCKGQTETRVEQAVRTSTNVRNRQNKSRDASLEYVDQVIQERDLLKNKILLVLIPRQKELNTNITGLIANQVAAKYKRPVMLLNERRDHDDDIWWEGSARGLSNCEIESFRNFLLDTNLIEYAEGHNNAFGVGLKNSNIESFIDYTNEQLKNINFSSKYAVDFIDTIETLDPQLVLTIGSWAELWGQEVSEPYIAITGVKITPSNTTIMKGSTIKIHTPKVDFIKFRATEEELNDLQTEGCLTVTIIGRCNINEWGGQQIPQIFIEDYDITQSLKYYY